MRVSTTGRIFDVMKYSIHDGPGIRTTVFLKGCPLSCRWCHNPEGQAPGEEIMIWDDRCIGCGDCLKACRYGAIVSQDGALRTARENCRICGECARVCFAGARMVAGSTVSIEKVVEEIEKDSVFYQESGGGVTFSGGEPLMQPGFLCGLLDECRRREIHVAVDTTGYGDLDDLLEIASRTDLFLYDLKLMDEEEHRKYTGVSNQGILANLKELSRHHSNIVVRIPVIPGVNDSIVIISSTGEFVSGLPGVRSIDLLPYHKAGIDKYRRLAKTCSLTGTEPPANEAMSEMAGTLERISHKKIRIGG